MTGNAGAEKQNFGTRYQAPRGLSAKSACRFQPAGFGVANLLRYFPWFRIGIEAGMRSAKARI
jgi:hypothetical protein